MLHALTSTAPGGFLTLIVPSDGDSDLPAWIPFLVIALLAAGFWYQWHKRR